MTVLTVQDSVQPARQARGIRIDFGRLAGKSSLYLDEYLLAPEKKIFDDLSRDIASGQLPVGGHVSYIGSCEFRDQPEAYPLVADFEYAGPQAPALRIFGGASEEIMFPGLTPSDLSKALGAAMDELKRGKARIPGPR